MQTSLFQIVSAPVTITSVMSSMSSAANGQLFQNVVNFTAPIGLDSIGFSSVPEPSVLGLAGLSVVVTALVIGRRKRVGIG